MLLWRRNLLRQMVSEQLLHALGGGHQAAHPRTTQVSLYHFSAHCI
jgi:hypothetical protein